MSAKPIPSSRDELHKIIEEAEDTQDELTKLTFDELTSLDLGASGVYQEVYRRFLDEPVMFELIRQEGYDVGYAAGYAAATPRGRL